MTDEHAPDRAGNSRLIITSMKNEGPYILEWIAYHRVIGFTDFLVYTNDCDDGTVEILERLQAMGVLTHRPNKILLRGPQKSALKWAKEEDITARADWILVSDIDEFLNIKIGDGTVQELINHLPEADVIPVTWRLFSHDDIVPFKDEPLLSQFTDAERPLNDGGFPRRYVKSIFRRQEDLKRFGTHGPIPEEGKADSFKWIAPDGRELGEDDAMTRPQSSYAYEIAQFNHYAVRSIDSYLIKRDRGRVNHYRQVMGVDYWQRMCRGGETDTSIQRHLEATKSEMDHLASDKELAGLHHASVQWHHDRIAELREAPDFAEMHTEILKLSDARNHHRSFAEAEVEDAARRAAEEAAEQVAETAAKVEAAIGIADPSPASAPEDARAMCAQLRIVFNQIEPVEASIHAQAKLDEIEKGLFGVTSR